MRDARRSTSGRRSGLRFDAEHGVVTEALLFLGELDPEAIGSALEDATHYEPTPVHECTALLRAIPQDVSSATFVDIGAGLGRVVMLASLRAFRQIVGVEVSSALCETARDNVVRWRRSHEQDLACKDLRIVCRDASRFRFPPGDLVVYLYNPFGERTLAQIIEIVSRHAGGWGYVIYHTPVHRTVLDLHPRFEQLADLGFAVVYKLRVS